MTKARDLSKIIDGSGNIVANNAGGDARSLGIVKADGSSLADLNRTTRQATIANSNCSGIIPSGNCSTAVANGYVDGSYNSSITYVDGTGTTQNQIDLPKPPNGNWWQWAGYGFSGVTTSNCANSGSYDGAGGFTQSFNAISVSSDFSGYSNTEDDLGGAYQTRTVTNCNCGSFNCRTNCNCNCACACDCACRD